MVRGKEDDDEDDENTSDPSGIENTPTVQAEDKSVAVGGVSIGGDVNAPIIVGTNITLTQSSNGLIANDAPPSNQPLYSPRTPPIDGLPADHPLFLDRSKALDAIQNTLHIPKPISIFGENGIGKTSFVRHLIHHADLSAFSKKILYLDASEHGLDDLLQILFYRFWESPPEFKPTEAALQDALHQAKALIFIDHLKLDQKETTSLRNAMPGCTFILVSREPGLPGESQKVYLEGLLDGDAVALFESVLASFVNVNHALNKEEQAAVRKLCALYHGNPERIVKAAALVAPGKTSIFQLLEASEQNDPDTILRRTVPSGLTKNQKQVLSILAVVGEAKLPLKPLMDLSQDQEFLETLQGLITLKLIQVDSGMYSLTRDLAASIAASENLSIWEDRLFDHFTGWLEGKPALARMEESTEAVLYLLKKASEQQNWVGVIRLGRALEPGLILGKRWQAWEELLIQIRDAANALGDPKVEAWALHQLGSRATFLGQDDRALELLNQALKLRRAINDQDGSAATQHNLAVLLRLPVPPHSPPEPVRSVSGGLSTSWISNWIGVGLVIAVLALATSAGASLFSDLIPRGNAGSSPQIEFTVTTSPASTATVAKTFTPVPSKTVTPQAPVTTEPITSADTGPNEKDFPSGTSPLTGLPACDPSLLEFPAVLVSISHFPPSGRPQAGLSFSSMVFEIYNGTDGTRFLAVFYGDCPYIIGPIRSGRLPYKQIQALFPGSCLVFAGADQARALVLRSCKRFNNTGNDVNGAVLSLAELKQIAQENPGYNQAFNYTGNTFSDSTPSDELSEAENISVFYSFLNQAQWSYDASSGKYLRSINGGTDQTAYEFTPATDRLTGEQLAFSNVIVMLAEHTVVEDPEVVDINMGINTSGDAYLFRDGKVFMINWTAVNGEYEQETGRRRPIRFTDAEGNPVPLKPGNTWIHLMSLSSRVQLSGDEWEARFFLP